MKERCPREHTLELFTPAELQAAHQTVPKYGSDAVFTCALCGKKERAHTYHCKSCQYEICPECYATPSTLVDAWGRKKEAGGWGLPRFLRPRAPVDREVPQFWEGVYTINWYHVVLLTVPPLISLYALLFVPCLPATAFWAGVCHFIAALGVTGGYHRLYSHCGYQATPFVQWLLVIAGSSALQGSAKWWARHHRAHHRYCDSDKDPYSATRGLVFSHMGWLVMSFNPASIGHVDSSDLNSNKIVQFQHKYYGLFALVFGIGLPTIIPGLFWGDWLGGFCYATMMKTFFGHHGTFFINSLAHFKLLPSIVGAAQTYSDKHSTVDNWFCSLLTNGEGYHNFHHEFPQDYRNGIHFWQYDPTKWVIRALSALGLVYNLVRFPGAEIEKGRLQQQYRINTRAGLAILTRLSRMDHGPEHEALPAATWADIHRMTTEEDRKLIVISGIVYDVAQTIEVGAGATHTNRKIQWYEAHPGGKKYLDAYNGKDATQAFQTVVYRHSHAAENLLQQLAAYRLVDEK